jgi:hypothetical protein
MGKGTVKHMRGICRWQLAGAAAVLGAAALCTDPTPAQSRRPKPDSPANLQALDTKAEDLEEAYLTGLLEVADGYEEAGELDKARESLEAILMLKPDSEAVKARLAEMEEAVFDANSHVVEVDVTKGWTTTGIRVTKDEPIRFEAEGTYRYILNETVGPDGFSQEDLMRDMASGVPSGALMGLIVPAPRPGQREPPQPDPPFMIGSARELEPSTDGTLLLRLNVPQGHKCVGKVKVNISGNIKPAS